MSARAKYTDAEKDRAVRIWERTGSLRQAAAETGISLGTIRVHRNGRTRRRGPDPAARARAWTNEYARKVLDGLDLTVMVPDDVDPDLARIAWAELVDEIAARP